MDQNWYTQDFSPKPPRKSTPIWLWFVGGCFVLLGLMVLLVAIVVSQIPQGEGAANWFADTTSTDNSQIVEFRSSGAVERLAAASAAYEKSLTPNEAVTADDIESIERFLQELKTIMQSGEEKDFESKLSMTEFKDRVRKARSLTYTARIAFPTQFDDWYSTFSPYSAPLQRIQLVSVERTAEDNTLIAYTWVFNSRFPDRVAWYLRSNGNQMRIVDFEILDTCRLESDYIARQFSAAFTGQYWDNFLEIFEYTPPETTSPEDTATAKAELQRLVALQFPKSLAHESYYQLALIAEDLDEHDLCLELLAKADAVADMPAAHWQRAMVFYGLEDYAKSELNLIKYTKLMGPGPECFQLEAEIATDQKQFGRANSAWVKLLAMDPGSSLSYDFHEHMTAGYGLDLAAAIQTRPDKVLAAQKVAQLLVDRERLDLADPLLVIAESGSEPNAELYALRAEVAALNGDDDENLKNLELAWKHATADNPHRASWLYQWSEKMVDQDKEVEMIQSSPDPGRTFFNLAVDEEGYINFDTKTLATLSDALQTVSVDTEPESNWLAAMKRLAPISVSLKRIDYPQAWNELQSLMMPEANSGDKKITAFLEEEGQTWLLHDWLATAAVHTNHTDEAWDLLSEDDRLSNLVWKATEVKSANVLQAIAAKLKAEDQEHPDLIYIDALKADWQNDTETAIRRYQEFMKHSAYSESPFQYSALYAVSPLALRHADWQTAVAGLPNDLLIDSFAAGLIAENRLDDADSVLKMVRQNGATLAETVPLEAAILHARRDVAGLSILCDRWLAELGPNEKSNDLWDSVYRDTVTYFVDAWIQTGNIQRAEQLIASLEGNYQISNHKLMIAIAKNDQIAAEAAYSDAIENSQSEPQILNLSDRAVWSREWREFRQRHPISFYQVDGDSSSDSNAILLLRSASPMTVDELRQRLQAVHNGVAVEDLSESLAQLEKRAAEICATDNDAADDVRNIPTGVRQLFRVNLNGSTFLLLFGSDQYHKPAGSPKNTDDESAFNDADLSEDLRQAIARHQGWILLRRETIVAKTNNEASKLLFPSVIGAMLDDTTSVACLHGHIHPMSSDLKDTLVAGTFATSSLAKTFSLPGRDPLLSVIGKRSNARLRALRKRLSAIPEGEVPDIRLLLNASGMWGRDQIPMECRLLKWEPQAFPSSFTVDLGENAILQPVFRNEYSAVGSWSILDWSE